MTDPALLDELGDYVSGVAGIDPEVRDQIIYRIAGVKRSGIPLPPTLNSGADILAAIDPFTRGAFTGWKGKSGSSKITLDEAEDHFSLCMADMMDAARAALPRAVEGTEDDLEKLVSRFAARLLAKLKLARANGRSGWERDDWEAHCQQGLLRHLEKGDPRDVAAYCAFMDHHGWVTKARAVEGGADLARSAFLGYLQAENECSVTGKPCHSYKCGCALEMQAFIDDAALSPPTLGRGADIEAAAAALAALLPNAISVDFNGDKCTSMWPNDFGPHEQAAFRLAARTMLSALSPNTGDGVAGEPVAWQARDKVHGGIWRHCDYPHSNPDFEYRPLYATPLDREALGREVSDEMVESGLAAWMICESGPTRKIVRMILEAALAFPRSECGTPEAPTSKSDVPDEIAWLIELPQSARPDQPPTYWGRVEEGEGWTREVNEAIKFNTKDGAEKYGSDIGILEYEVIEHAWGTPLPQGNAGE